MVNGIISFKNTIQFRGIWSFAIPKYLEEDNCTIYGENGTLSFSFYEEELLLNTEKQNKVFKFKNPVEDGALVISIMEEFTKE